MNPSPIVHLVRPMIDLTLCCMRSKAEVAYVTLIPGFMSCPLRLNMQGVTLKEGSVLSESQPYRTPEIALKPAPAPVPVPDDDDSDNGWPDGKGPRLKRATTKGLLVELVVRLTRADDNQVDATYFQMLCAHALKYLGPVTLKYRTEPKPPK